MDKDANSRTVLFPETAEGERPTGYTTMHVGHLIEALSKLPADALFHLEAHDDDDRPYAIATYFRVEYERTTPLPTVTLVTTVAEQERLEYQDTQEGYQDSQEEFQDSQEEARS